MKGKIHAQTSSQIIAMSDKIQKCIQDVKVPFYAVIGTDDKFCDVSGVKALFENSATKEQQKDLDVIEGMSHDVLHSTIQDSIIKDIISWLHQRSKAL